MAIYSQSIEGLDELLKDFERIGDDALPYLKTAADAAGALVLERTRAEAPARTGNLKRNLKLTKAKKSAKYKYNVFSTVSFKSEGYYGVFVELGHKVVRDKKTVGVVTEKPFMRPAADKSRDDVFLIIQNALNKALDELGGRK